MPVRTGRFAVIEQFLADGMNVMFGNPGTVEQGFLDSLEQYPDFKYIMGLQETIAVAMGDGYARVTKKPTLVQLHSGVGLGNGIGMMYQAMRGHAPLVVIAGESGVQYDAMDAQMAADLVSMAKPVTKWATRVVDPNSVLRVLRRAIKDRHDAADGSGLRVSAGRCARCPQRRAGLPDAAAGYPRRACGGASREGGVDAGGRTAPHHHHG